MGAHVAQIQLGEMSKDSHINSCDVPSKDFLKMELSVSLDELCGSNGCKFTLG